jgi:hypothetical protein
MAKRLVIFSVFIIFMSKHLASNLKMHKSILTNELLTITNEYQKLITDTNKLQSNQTQIEKENFYYTHEDIKSLIDNNEKYDIENRLIPLTKFKNDNIKAYQLISIKPIAKHDNGHYLTNLIILAYTDSIRLLDNYGNQLMNFKIDFQIGEIYSFQNSEGNLNFILDSSFYVLASNKKDLIKYQIFVRKIEKKDEHSNNENEPIDERQKIVIKTYKENQNNYEISLTYTNQLKKHDFIIEKSEVFTSDKIIKEIKLYITKGNKMIILANEDNSLNILTEELKPNKFKLDSLKYSEDLVFSLFLNFVGYVENANKIVINNIEKQEENYECNLASYVQNGYIANILYDSYNQVIYVLLNDKKLLVISFSNKQNECFVLKTYEFNEELGNNDFSSIMYLVRKDLIIKSGNRFVFMDTTDIEKGLAYKTVALPFSEANKKEKNLVYLRTQPNNYLMLFNDGVELHLYEVVNPSVKFTSGEDTGSSFNFKVPVILISLVFIFIYHYFKNKKSAGLDDVSKDKMNEDIMKKLASLGVMDVKDNINI